MSSRLDATVPATRRPRKSTSQSPVRKRMEKENITVDLASSLAGNGGRKKSRSKSMGPGGLDVLKSASGNRRMSLAAPIKPPPRSILKPTMPLLPDIPPHKPKTSARKSPPDVQGADKLPNPFQNEDSGSAGTKVALRTEEEQQAAAREREERERAQMEKEINDRREARRKSLANRRVSFAAEATLHTFHDIDYGHESTTSTDSTRRASSLASRSPAAPSTPASSEANDPPSTPPGQVENIIPASPDDQRELHQKKRRRSSSASTLNFTNADDMTFASSVYSSDSEGADGMIEAPEEIGSDSGSDSDADGVSMDLDADEMTGVSIASAVSARSEWTTGSDDTLEGALRLASRRAEVEKIDAEEEVIPSFGWVKKPASKQPSPPKTEDAVMKSIENNKADTQYEDQDNSEMEMDMDMTNAMGAILTLQKNELEDDRQHEEMSMDVTRAFGSIPPQRRQQTASPSASPENLMEGSSMEEATMDLRMAYGGIQRESQATVDDDEDEDMSMDLTTAMGGVISGGKQSVGKRQIQNRRQTMTGNDEATMDMTIGLGRILPADQNNDNEDEDHDDVTMGMEITTAIGGIIKGSSPLKDRNRGKQLMEEEVDKADSTPLLSSPSKRRISGVISTVGASETGSPSLSAFRGKGLRRSDERETSDTPKSKSPIPNKQRSRSSSPAKPTTPTARLQSSPLKTPPSKKTPVRSASPKRVDINNTVTTPRDPLRSLFQQDASTGKATPQVLLTPQQRRLSGVGADRPGLGSPKVSAIFDRRGSIGETANEFLPREDRRAVTFADPRTIEFEVDRERQLEDDKENGRKILEREADGDEENNTATLKDLISSMTPRKNLARGRKSLHVGSAKGLLGKRPAELDDDDDAEERDGVKRLKGHQSSPVKNVRLHAPPSKAETTGRLTRSSAKSLTEADNPVSTPTLTLSSREESRVARSPQDTGRFRHVESDQPTSTVNFDESRVLNGPELQVDDDRERIHLQDFLNMTSIRFMELTTTKRRHTQAPAAQRDSFAPDKTDSSLESCVVAGACTVPTLELYQHSCQELKKYISEGRRIVREIETETFEENPPLFREYMSATPEFKTLMDNQFKNVKTHARLLSKAMWYEWRMKLQDGLKEGLIKIADGMTADENILRQQQDLLDSVLPDLTKRSESIQVEHDRLESFALELAACDPDELEAARAELTEVDSDIQAKMQKIAELHLQLSETEASVSVMSQRKGECAADIEEAEKIREECRGWTSNEVSALKARVNDLERRYGWAITGTAGTTISLTFRKEIELVLDVSAFHGQGLKSTSRIDLWYIAANRERDAQPTSPEKEFFVQSIRDHVRGVLQPQTKIRHLLDMVSAAWRKANHVTQNLRLLNSTFPTNVNRTSDSSIAVQSTLLLRQMQTKVEITLGLHSKSTQHGIEILVSPRVRVVYGEHFKVDNIVEYLASRIPSPILTKEENNEVESWMDVVIELQERLLARGKK